MRKSLLAVAVLVLLVGAVGCGNLSRASAQLTGYSRQCVGGVSYLQFSSGVTVEYNPNGTIKTCS